MTLEPSCRHTSSQCHAEEHDRVVGAVLVGPGGQRNRLLIVIDRETGQSTNPRLAARRSRHSGLQS
jgi:hypothetical protein